MRFGRTTLPLLLAVTGTLAIASPVGAAAASRAGAPAACAVPPPSFATPSYVDTTRAGGEP